MTNIILQHFDGELRELDKLSMENIKDYARMVNADYQLVRGKPFRSHLTAPCQKVFMLDEMWDKYDDVLMLDIDMFAPKGMTDNIFKEEGIGLYEDVQKRLHHKISSLYPMIANFGSHYWGGAIYKMDKPTRQKLRKELGGNEGWMQNYNELYHFEDEGIIHTLVFRSGFKTKTPFLNKRWCQCSFLPNPEKAGFIHIRTKITPNGPKREKIDNYKDLVNKGIL
tara:strand:- start:2376 stop:3047 length:672 start_codon:yes stop_codon:yes gene_type:complete